MNNPHYNHLQTLNTKNGSVIAIYKLAVFLSQLASLWNNWTAVGELLQRTNLPFNLLNPFDSCRLVMLGDIFKD
jgi:hypothetical protein